MIFSSKIVNRVSDCIFDCPNSNVLASNAVFSVSSSAILSLFLVIFRTALSDLTLDSSNRTFLANISEPYFVTGLFSISGAISTFNPDCIVPFAAVILALLNVLNIAWAFKLRFNIFFSKELGPLPNFVSLSLSTKASSTILFNLSWPSLLA